MPDLTTCLLLLWGVIGYLAAWGLPVLGARHGCPFCSSALSRRGLPLKPKERDQGGEP